MIAIISDIHGNLEALEAALQDIEKQGIKDIYCLGDIVGYGPNPVECLEASRSFKLTVCGNHDEAVLKRPFGFNEIAAGAINWTRAVLRPRWFSRPRRKRQWRFLEGLPVTHLDNDILFVHGSPRDPTIEYIFESEVEDPVFGAPEKIEEIFSLFKTLCFVGHTHAPGVITQDFRFFSPEECGYRYDFEEGKKYIVNVGSIGQPRDRDNRACYAVVDGNRMYYRRVAYDYQKVLQKVQDTHDLNERCGSRLREGE